MLDALVFVYSYISEYINIFTDLNGSLFYFYLFTHEICFAKPDIFILTASLFLLKILMVSTNFPDKLRPGISIVGQITKSESPCFMFHQDVYHYLFVCS